jgi:hypothetical protein
MFHQFRVRSGRGLAGGMRKSGGKRAEPLTYAAWKARAVEIMGGRAGIMPEREWKRAYITNMTLDDAAKLAETLQAQHVRGRPEAPQAMTAMTVGHLNCDYTGHGDPLARRE